MVALDERILDFHHSQYGTIGQSHTDASFRDGLPSLDGNRRSGNGDSRHLRLQRTSHVLAIVFHHDAHRVNWRIQNSFIIWISGK